QKSKNYVEIVYDVVGRKVVTNDRYPTLPVVGITEKDFVNIRLINVKNDEINDYQIVELSKESLGDLIRVVGDIQTISKKTPPDSSRVEPQYSHLVFSLGKLKGGLKYKFLIRRKKGEQYLDLGEFVTEVDEIIHVHVRLGHVFTKIADQNFKIVPTSPKDTTFRIDKSLPTGEGLLISGASFHPWGYNPRHYNGWQNIGFMIAVPFNKKIGESFFTGINWGGKGLYLVFGANWAKVKKVIKAYDNVTLSQKIDINEVTTETWEIGIFGGVWFDIDVVSKILPFSQ
ncbi:MAG: hypothetical protein ACREAE_08895, partial [Nitrosopumilaceae archaeon]